MKKNKRERQYITEFIKCITQQNFAAANKCIKKALHEKIKAKIAIAGAKPLFK